MEMILTRALISLNPSPVVTWSFQNKPEQWMIDKRGTEKIKERRLIIMVPIGFLGSMVSLLSSVIKEKEFSIVPMLQEPIVHNKPEFGILFNASLGINILDSMDQSSKGKLIFCFQLCFKIKRCEDWIQLSELYLLRKFRGKNVKVLEVRIVSSLTDSSTLCFKTTSREVVLTDKLLVTKDMEDEDIFIHILSKRIDIPNTVSDALKELKKEMYAD